MIIGPEPHPVARSAEPTAVAAEGLAIYPPISAINGGPPVHPKCVHVLTPFVERLAREDERKAGITDPKVLNQSPAGLQRRCRRDSHSGKGRA